LYLSVVASTVQYLERRLLSFVTSANGMCVVDVKRRIGLASAMAGRFNKLCKSSSISNKTTVKLYKSFVVLVLLYGSESERREKENPNSRDELAPKNTRNYQERQSKKRNNMGNIEARSWLPYGQDKEKKIDLVRPRVKDGRQKTIVKSDVRRNRGRQPKRWIDNVKEDIRERQLDIREAINLTRDRTRLRRLVTITSSLCD